MIRRILLAFLLLVPLPAIADCPRGILTGKVTNVRDGDTIELGAIAFRLNGLAAPEWDEPGGEEATEAMRDLVRGEVVTCELDGDQTYDRCAAICTLEGGADIAEMLVRVGLARDCPRFSGGRYQQAEQTAAAQGATIGETYRLPG
jgi:micrococcal nuclease